MSTQRCAKKEARDLIAELARGYCPNCGCDLCNTRGCPTCTWMRKARKLLDGDAYVEPPILDADPINVQNVASKGLLFSARNYLNALSDNRVKRVGRDWLELCESALRCEVEAL